MKQGTHYSVLKQRQETIETKTRNVSLGVDSTKKNDQPEKKKAVMLPPSRNDSREARDNVETVLRDASKEMATVLLMMPPIAREIR